MLVSAPGISRWSGAVTPEISQLNHEILEETKKRQSEGWQKIVAKL